MNIYDLLIKTKINFSALSNFARLSTTKVGHITINSRKVKKGSIFVACKGATNKSLDGHNFIDNAIKNGARCIIVEKFIKKKACLAPIVKVDNTRIAAAKLIEIANDNPSSDLDIIGITGTNGKTSVCSILAQLLNLTDVKAAVFGTIGIGHPSQLTSSNMTTPEAEEISSKLNKLRDQGYEKIAMEVSSHALATHRVDGVKYAVVAWTNLSQDHLDFHKNMKDYKNSKMRLLTEIASKKTPIVLPHKEIAKNIYHDGIIDTLANPIITYGFNERSFIFASNMESNKNKLQFLLNIAQDKYPISLDLIGKFNIENFLCAIACCVALNMDIAKIIDQSHQIKPIVGRMQKLNKANNDQPDVFIDFAHTPDALQKSLNTLQELKYRKINLVFGCGGNRDQDKRSKMGQIAADLTDYIVLTNDNPRYECPSDIIGDIEQGIKSSKKNASYNVVLSRKEAIAKAIKYAHSKDVILIAGKGHEKYQEQNGEKMPFSDHQVAIQCLTEL